MYRLHVLLSLQFTCLWWTELKVPRKRMPRPIVTRAVQLAPKCICDSRRLIIAFIIGLSDQTTEFAFPNGTPVIKNLLMSRLDVLIEIKRKIAVVLNSPVIYANALEVSSCSF